MSLSHNIMSGIEYMLNEWWEWQMWGKEEKLFLEVERETEVMSPFE